MDLLPSLAAIGALIRFAGGARGIDVISVRRIHGDGPDAFPLLSLDAQFFALRHREQFPMLAAISALAQAALGRGIHRLRIRPIDSQRKDAVIHKPIVYETPGAAVVFRLVTSGNIAAHIDHSLLRGVISRRIVESAASPSAWLPLNRVIRSSRDGVAQGQQDGGEAQDAVE